MRESHPPRAGKCSKSRAKSLGMVCVEDGGLVMKLRGMMHNPVPEFSRAPFLRLIICRKLFFPFDLNRGFL
jgi:hypothetical protein